MKKFLFYLSLICFSGILTLQTYAAQQEEKQEKPVSVKLGGFLKNDLFYDSRRIVGAVDELFSFYPLDINKDPDGVDINDVGRTSFNMSAARFNTLITGPDVFGASVIGFIEFDFTGDPGANGTRFRHAFVRFNWEKSSVLFGQFWHPLFVTDAFPKVMGLNTGAPFQVFHRTPQLRFTHELATNFRVIATGMYQNTYRSMGPIGSTSLYQRDAVIPAANIRLEYGDKANNLIGISGDVKTIMPQRVTDSGYAASTTLTSYTAMAYFKFKPVNKMEVKGRAMYGQNTADHLMMGGYAVRTHDPLTGRETYTNYNNFSTWLNVLYGNKLKGGIFAGYSQNLGADHKIGGKNYARGADIHHAYRISPMITYSVGSLLFGFEWEYTAAAYASTDENENTMINEKGLVTKHHTVANHRPMLSVMYFF